MNATAPTPRVARKAAKPPAAIPSNADAPTEKPGAAALDQAAQPNNGPGISGGPEPDMADAAAPPAPLKTRRSRKDGGSDDFDVPMSMRKPGYDYEYKTTKVNGQPVDDADMAFYRDNGWEPVVASQMPGLLAPGSSAKFIERRGQILMCRPDYLSVESRAEDYEIAEQQKFDKLQSASAIAISRPGLINATKPEITIEGEVGRQAPKAPK